MKRIINLIIIFASLSLYSYGQQITLTKDQIIAITPEWKGERLPDGRPNVSDKLLQRLKNISIEEAWGILRNAGYNNQFEGEYLLPEFKHLDFLWLMRDGSVSDTDLQRIINPVRSITGVQLVVELTNEKIKNKEHLVF